MSIGTKKVLAIARYPFWLLKSYICQGEVLKFLFPGFLYFATLQETTFIDNTDIFTY